MTNRWIELAAATMLLVGCAGADTAPPEFQVDAGVQLDDAGRALIGQLAAACPGLDQNRSDWTVKSVGLDEGDHKVEIQMAQPLQGLPFNTYATGHTCTFEFGEEAPDSIGVMKRPCVAACQGAASDVPPSTYIRIK